MSLRFMIAWLASAYTNYATVPPPFSDEIYYFSTSSRGIASLFKHGYILKTVEHKHNIFVKNKTKLSMKISNDYNGNPV